MKDIEEISRVRDNVIESGNQFYGMTYEEGIRDALEWILGELSDEDFGYVNNKGENHDN